MGKAMSWINAAPVQISEGVFPDIADPIVEGHRIERSGLLNLRICEFDEAGNHVSTAREAVTKKGFMEEMGLIPGRIVVRAADCPVILSGCSSCPRKLATAGSSCEEP